jgi:hypothetical protein
MENTSEMVISKYSIGLSKKIICHLKLATSNSLRCICKGYLEFDNVIMLVTLGKFLSIGWQLGVF